MFHADYGQLIQLFAGAFFVELFSVDEMLRVVQVGAGRECSLWKPFMVALAVYKKQRSFVSCILCLVFRTCSNSMSTLWNHVVAMLRCHSLVANSSRWLSRLNSLPHSIDARFSKFSTPYTLQWLNYHPKEHPIGSHVAILSRYIYNPVSTHESSTTQAPRSSYLGGAGTHFLNSY